MEKPYSPSCERNKEAILKELQDLICEEDQSLLEIGSGTGQHAVYFAPFFPSLVWQTSDLLDNHSGINLWIEESNSSNVLRPIEYQAGDSEWPNKNYDLVFSANSLHIMSWKECCFLFEDLSQLKKGSKVIFYGPFNFKGEYSSESNAEFDIWLKQRNSKSAIRDFEKVKRELELAGLDFVIKIEMPANNELLVFIRS